MKLLTKTIRAKLPQLYAQDENPDPVVWVKFFCPWNQWTWLATEGSGEGYTQRGDSVVLQATNAEIEMLCRRWLNSKQPPLPYVYLLGDARFGVPDTVYTLEDFRFFGYVHGLEDELGHFSLREMKSVHTHRTSGPLGIERDIHFTPAPLSEVLARHTKSHGWTPTWTPRKEANGD